MTSLLAMPPEIRAIVWRILYEDMAKPRVSYAANNRGGVVRYAEVERGLLLTCRQLHAEVRPFLLANLDLHIVYPDHTPCQLGVLPPALVRHNARVIHYHCGQNEWDDHRPPKRPFPFHQYPAVRTLRVTKATPVYIGQLRAVWRPERPKLTRAIYEKLPDKMRYRAWKASGIGSVDRVITYMSGFGRGGWLSRVIDPIKYSDPIELDPDVDDEFEDDRWQYCTRDFEAENRVRRRRIAGLEPEPSEDSVEGQARRQADLVRCREVVSGLRVILELEYNLSTGERDRFMDSIFEVLLVVVDVQARKILDYRFLMDKEIWRREKWSQQANW